MLVPKELMRLISAREEVGKDSGKKPIGLISANHYRCSETAIVYPRQNTPRKESLKYTESARPIGAARKSVRNLLEQRAGTYWSSAQLVSYAHQDLLEQRASRSGTYWSSAQVSLNLLEQRASRFRKHLIFLDYFGFLPSIIS